MDLLVDYDSDVSDTSGVSANAVKASLQPAAPALPPDFFEPDTIGTNLSAKNAERTTSINPVAVHDQTNRAEDGSALPFATLPKPKSTKVATFRVPINLAALAADSDDDDGPRVKRAKVNRTGAKLADFLPAPKNQLSSGSKRVAAPQQTAGLAQNSAGAHVGPAATDTVHPQAHNSNMYANGNEAYAYTNDAYAVAGTDDSYAQHNGTHQWTDGQTAAGAGFFDSGGAGAHSAGTAGWETHTQSVQHRAQGYGAPQQQAAGPGPSSDELLAAALAAEGKGANIGTIKLVEVDQRQLTYMDPSQKAEMQGVAAALGPTYAAQLRSQAGPAPNRLAKRKHQIGTLFHQAKAMELELLQKGAKAAKTKGETQAKYGW